MRRLVAALVGALLVLTLAPALAHGPADWIMQGQHKNAAGEWCCGEGDCFVVPSDLVMRDPDGSYLIMERDVFPNGDAVAWPIEKIPEAEAQPSPDGQFWRCKRPDGSRRCFFAPPPNS